MKILPAMVFMLCVALIKLQALHQVYAIAPHETLSLKLVVTGLYKYPVGAGLPINHTVRDLRESGDSIYQLVVFSQVHYRGYSYNLMALYRLVNW